MYQQLIQVRGASALLLRAGARRQVGIGSYLLSVTRNVMLLMLKTVASHNSGMRRSGQLG